MIGRDQLPRVRITLADNRLIDDSQRCDERFTLRLNLHKRSSANLQGDVWCCPTFTRGEREADSRGNRMPASFIWWALSRPVHWFLANLERTTGVEPVTVRSII